MKPDLDYLIYVVDYLSEICQRLEVSIDYYYYYYYYYSKAPIRHTGSRMP